MNDHRYLLSIFLLCNSNINLPTNDNHYSSSSNLLNLFRYNNNELMKYITSNVDLLREEINNDYINDKIKYYLNHNVSQDLNRDIEIFWKFRSLINHIYLYLDKKISRSDLNLLIQFIKNVYKLEIININDYINLINYFKNINNDIIKYDDKLKIINDLKDLIKLIRNNKLLSVEKRKLEYLNIINDLFKILNIQKFK